MFRKGARASAPRGSQEFCAFTISKVPMQLPPKQGISELDTDCVTDSTCKQHVKKTSVRNSPTKLDPLPTTLETSPSPYGPKRHFPSEVPSKAAIRWGRSPLKGKQSQSTRHLSALSHCPKSHSQVTLDVKDQVTANTRVKNTDIRVPSFRKKLYTYLLRCKFTNKLQRKGAAEAVARGSARESRMKMPQSEVPRITTETRMMRQVSRRKCRDNTRGTEDACVGCDDPMFV